jgi:hypothetical protein
MAERKVIDCDRCGKETKLPIRINIPNGSEYHFDGVESNIDFLYEQKDLCPGCANDLLRFMFKHKKKCNGPDQDLPELYVANRYEHPKPKENDSIRLALKFLDIKEKDYYK